MRVNRVVVGVLLWLVAVVTVAGLAWFAIDSAGKSVTALPDSEPVLADPSAAAAGTDNTPAAQPTSVPPPSISSAPASTTGAPSGVSSPVSASRPNPNKSHSPHPAPSTSSRPSTHTSTPPPPHPARKTTSGTWGSVTIVCTPDGASLVGAAPANGWTVKVGSNGTPKVEVDFNGGQGPPVHVEGTCPGGKPAFSFDD
jgi:hypothetical protein